MLKNEKLRDVRIAFIFSSTLKKDKFFPAILKRDNWRAWTKSSGNKDELYYWGTEEKRRKVHRTKDQLSSTLEDYILVENFFLSKQLFHVGRDYTMISRSSPSIDLELILPIKGKDGNAMKVKPTVIISFYRAIDVITLMLNIVLDEIGADDLVYIKSLKCYSIKNYPDAPKINITINGEDRGDQYLYNIFKMVHTEVFGDKLKTRTESESILDLIEIRDKNIGEHIFNKRRNDLLFGLLLGDEGYIIDSVEMMDKYLNNPDICFNYRSYFKYFFAPTTILGVFSKEYPKLNKEGFAKVYAERYANFEPLCQYLNLVSDIANLSDGLAVAGEVTLVRYTVLKEIDQNIRTGFEEGKMRFKQLLKLKREITTRISSIELLAKDVLWINLLFSDNMFGYKSIKINIQERLEYIDSQIRDKYNTKIQNRLLLLTTVIVILTLMMVYMMFIDSANI